MDICIPTNAHVDHYPRASMDSNINLEKLLSVFCTFAVCWYFFITDQLLHVSLVHFCLYTEKNVPLIWRVLARLLHMCLNGITNIDDSDSTDTRHSM